jgi:chromosome segregation ATPase
VSEYKVDLSNFREEPPTPWTDEQYRVAFQSLVIKYHEMKNERDTLIDDLTWYKAKIKRLNVANENLKNRVKNLELTGQELHDDLMQSDGEVRQLKNTNNILINDNDRLIRRNQKLEAYVRMWEKLTKWKQGKLAERCNNDLLHELSYTMNELERDMYKGRDI